MTVAPGFTTGVRRPSQDDWIETLGLHEATHAVSGTYNDETPGVSTGQGYRVTPDGQRIPVRARRQGRPGEDRLPTRFKITEDRIRSHVDRLHYWIDRELLGARFNRPAYRSRRTSYIGLIEHVDSNIHWHCQWRVPLTWGDEHERFKALLPHLWKRIAPFGSCLVEPLHDATGWAEYITKELRDPRLQGSPRLLTSRFFN